MIDSESLEQQPLLRVVDLKKHFGVKVAWERTAGRTVPQRMWQSVSRRKAKVKAVDGVSFTIAKGETLGLVGESGCGKSTLGRTILRLLGSSDGTIELNGQRIDSLDQAALRPIRKHMQMVFQDPYVSLNPRMRVGDAIAEPLDIFGLVQNSGEKAARVAEILEMVGLTADSATKFPHEFSGGQRQRIGIARALAVRPQFIICDEPVSALDVSIQAQIINLLLDLQQSENLTYLFISHDLKVVRHICDRVAVMYLGKIIELSTTDEVYRAPMHPYTKALLSSVPKLVPSKGPERILLQGDVPNPMDIPPGCSFHTRCPVVDKPTACFSQEPPLVQIGERQVACHVVSAHEL